MKRILITGAGGSPATNFVRSLRSAPEQFYFVGTDCDAFYLQRAETDQKYLLPQATDPCYIPLLNEIIRTEKINFIHAQNDTEIKILSEHRKSLCTAYFLPNKKTVKRCHNKFSSYALWKKAGLPQPATALLHTQEDLRCALEEMSGTVWLRAIEGAGGKGSILARNYKSAKSWIDFNEGWGTFTAAEYLSPQSITWQSIWHNGKLVVAQSRKRLYWELAKVSPSGITGATGAGMTCSDTLVNRMARKAIHAIDKKPHGIFSVDLTYDKRKVPNPTEINIGRFFTTHEFFTRAGLNMPYIYIKLAFNEPCPPVIKKINPLPNNLIWIRGIDFLPVFTKLSTIQRYNKELKAKIKHIRQYEKSS